ncbi:MAG TPA: helix-turn-helix domain-containing protein [Mycobacterium sp.]|nr:helix-turn-helix domain-containing protein [Mycobacterium sp.]
MTSTRPVPVPLTAPEAAALLGIAPRTLLAHKDEWQLTSRKLGKSWVFLQHEVLGLLDGGASD